MCFCFELFHCCAIAVFPNYLILIGLVDRLETFMYDECTWLKIRY